MRFGPIQRWRQWRRRGVSWASRIWPAPFSLADVAVHQPKLELVIRASDHEALQRPALGASSLSLAKPTASIAWAYLGRSFCVPRQ